MPPSPPAQVRAVQQNGRMIGQSSSLSAADFLRWRDIAFNADPESRYGDPAGAAAAALAQKRKSDGFGEDEARVSRAPSASLTASAFQRMSLMSAGGVGSPAHSRTGSFVVPDSPRQMSREELFANLQASAQKLNRSSGSLKSGDLQFAGSSGLRPTQLHVPQSPVGSPIGGSSPLGRGLPSMQSDGAMRSGGSMTYNKSHSTLGPMQKSGPSGSSGSAVNNRQLMAEGKEALRSLMASSDNNDEGSLFDLPPTSPMESAAFSRSPGSPINRIPENRSGTVNMNNSQRPVLNAAAAGSSSYRRSATQPFMPSRLSTSFTTQQQQQPGSPVSRQVAPLMPAPPASPQSHASVSPRTNSFSSKSGSSALSPTRISNKEAVVGNRLEQQMDALLNESNRTSSMSSKGSQQGSPGAGTGLFKKVFG